MDRFDFLKNEQDLIIILIISAMVMLLSLGLIVGTFFAVRISGAQEEGDDVFFLIRLGFVTCRDGTWYIKLGDVFDENAVIKLRFGVTYLAFFEGRQIEGIASGTKPGVVSDRISKNTTLLRRKIRRN